MLDSNLFISIYKASFLICAVSLNFFDPVIFRFVVLLMHANVHFVTNSPEGPSKFSFDMTELPSRFLSRSRAFSETFSRLPLAHLVTFTSASVGCIIEYDIFYTQRRRRRNRFSPVSEQLLPYLPSRVEKKY